MITNFSQTKTFIPKWAGNLELPTADQIRVDYKAPTLEMRNKLLPPPKYKFQFDHLGNPDGGEAEVKYDREMVLATMISKIHNCGNEDESGTHFYYNAKELMKAPAAYGDLAEEIFDHFKKELQEVLPEKN